VPRQERGQEIRHRRALDAFFDLGPGDDIGDLLAVLLVDLVGRRADVGLGVLFLRVQERLQHFALLIENREVVGKIVEDLMDDPAKALVERIFLAHDRRPAESSLRELVDQEARRMGLLREERAVEHRRLQHRDLQPGEQCLDAVGQVARLEDEVEQHGDHLDRHRLDLVGLGAERGFLQIAQDIVQTVRDAGERDRRATDIETGLTGLQARQALVQVGAGDDRRARHVPGRGRRHRRERAQMLHPGHGNGRQVAVAAGRRIPHRRRPHRRRPHRRVATGVDAMRMHAGGGCRRRPAAIHALEQRHHVHLGRRRGVLRGLGRGALRGAFS
jgi:hypothetical protein